MTTAHDNQIDRLALAMVWDAMRNNDTPITRVHYVDGGGIRVASVDAMIDEVLALDEAILLTDTGEMIHIITGQSPDTIVNYSSSLDGALFPIMDWINSLDRIDERDLNRIFG